MLSLALFSLYAAKENKKERKDCIQKMKLSKGGARLDLEDKALEFRFDLEVIRNY